MIPFHSNLFTAGVFKRAATMIVEQHFGSIVSRVTKQMFSTSISTVSTLCSLTKLPKNVVKEALHVLTLHNLARVEWFDSRQCHYQLLKYNIFNLMRRDKYVYHARTEVGVEAELVLEMMHGNGRSTASQIIVAVCCKMALSPVASEAATGTAAESPLERHITVRNALCKLVEQQYLQRSPAVAPRPSPNQDTAAADAAARAEGEEEQEYNFPSSLLDLAAIKREVERRLCSEDITEARATELPPATDFPDDTVSWIINHDTFHWHWRNTLLCTVVSTQSTSTDCGHVFRAMLMAGCAAQEDKWCSYLKVTATEVRQALPDTPHIDQLLTQLEQISGGSVQRRGSGGGGGEYCIDVALFISQLTKNFVGRRIQEKFGSKASRIFRLVLEKMVLSGDAIASYSSLDKKESDQLSNTLLLNNILQVMDLRKTSMPPSAARELLLYRVKLLQVVRMMAGESFTAVHNMLRTRDLHFTANKSLMDKKTRVDAILQNFKSEATPEQIKEVEEALTSSERISIDKWHENQDMMLSVAAGITEDVFLMELYLRYYTCMENLNTGRRPHCV